MDKTFREYHKFTKEEFEQLWNNCLFVFDTNTLLNMYRYSRETVDAYIKVLEEIKSKNQLWLPYQVGLEFHENRINVIFEYEKSYDEILSIINRTKEDIQQKYKNHPFLDLGSIGEEMSKGLAGVITTIKQKKDDHPKWIEKDEVLEKLNKIFEGNTGNNFDLARMIKIKEEGKERYDKKIPPGFKDVQKPEEKKYGDLILWYQILEKAKDCKKPIILISGDVKEDWWLEKDGKRLMPLPQLKKEMLDKAGVDFHIYTADNFLEVHAQGKTIDQRTIKEVRKIREIEEARMKRHMHMLTRRGDIELDPRAMYGRMVEYSHTYEALHDLMRTVRKVAIPNDHKDDFEHIYRGMDELQIRFRHGEIDDLSTHKLRSYGRDLLMFLDKIYHSSKLEPEAQNAIKECVDRIERIIHGLGRYL